MPASEREKIFGFWEVDLAKQPAFSCPEMKVLLGYQASEYPDGWSFLKLAMDSTQWFRLKRTIITATRTSPFVPFKQNLTLRHKNASLFHFVVIGRVKELKAAANLWKMEGSYANISHLHGPEKELVRVKNLFDTVNREGKIADWQYDLHSKIFEWTKSAKLLFQVPDHFEPDMALFLSYFKDNIELVEALRLCYPFQLDLFANTELGKELFIRVTAIPESINDECVRIKGTIQDITEFKAEKEILRIHDQQLASFIQQLPVAIAIIDDDQKYIAASNVWKAHFDLEHIEVAGKSHYKLFPDTPEIWKQYHKRGMEGENLKMDEDSFLDWKGNTEWMQWEIRPWFEISGKIGGVILFGSKVSERHAFNDTIMKAMVTAEESNKIKSDFLSVMSHEIRTPLNAILGFINLLLQDPRSDQVEKMSILKFSAENLLAIINNILDYNKLEVGKITLEEIDFNLRNLLGNIQSSMQLEAENKNLDLLLSVDPLIPDIIHSDPVRMGQILNNLISNAIKFTHTGQVSVALRLKADYDKNINVEFEIEDTGIGIPADQHNAVFEMFTQADASTTRKYGGSGLGLSISQELAEMMGSKIRLTSVPDQGSIFSFDLNLKKKQDREPELTAGNQIKPDLHGLRVLIVEDQLINTMVLRNFLQQWNCVCSVAENGRVAVEMVESNIYDLVLMDLQMPEMDGYQAARTIRTFVGEKFSRLPIIAITASAVPSIKGEIFDAGMNGVIGKPFEPKELFGLISTLAINN